MADVKKHEVTFFLDDEPLTTREKALTPVEILGLASLTSPLYYLVEVVGNEQKSYKDSPDTPIHIHEKMKFSSIYTGQTTVSSVHAWE